MSIIFGIVAYVISGFIMGRVVMNYMHELQRKCWQMRDPGYDLFIHMNYSKAVCYIMQFIGGILWPISDIALLLHAEWVYSGKVTNYRQKGAA